MYKKILVATDGSEQSRRAFAQAATLARQLKADIAAVAVTEMWTAVEMVHESRRHTEHPTEEFERRATAWASHNLSNVVAMAKAEGLQCETVHISDTPIAAGIVKAAKDLHCDLVVMGSHGRNAINTMLLGSQVIKVLSLTQIPVLVCR